MSFEVQADIRRQALELQDSIKELHKFTEQAKKKDAALKAAAELRAKAMSGIPPRSQAAVSSEAATAQPARRPGAAKPQTGFSFDRSRPDDNSAADASDRHRERGNALFKTGKYAEAREAYSASLTAKRTHLALANRAMTALKLRDFAAAEADCTAAIELDAGYIKAYQRRSVARAEQGDHLGAIDDLDMAVRLQPGSKALAAECAAAIDRYHAETDAPRPTHMRDIAVRSEGVDAAAPSATMPPASTAAAAASLQPAQSSKVSAAAAAAPAMASSPKQPEALTAVQTSGDRRSSHTAVAPTPPPASPVPNQPPQPSAVSPSQRSTPPAQPHSQATQGLPPASEGVLPSTASATAVSSLETGAPSAMLTASAPLTPLLPPDAAAASPTGPPAQPSLQQPNGHVVANGTAPSKSPGAAAPSGLPVRPGSGGSVPVKLTRPATGLDFERTWRTLAGQPERQAQYLLMLRPEQLPQLLRVSLTAPLLAGMLPPLLSLLAEDCDADHAVDLLAKLPAVPRFDLAAMSLVGPAKAALSVLWDDRSRNAAGGDPVASERLKQRLAALKPKYRL